jgi:pimeloyl-ACP methyl ester carboxylesterase
MAEERSLEAPLAQAGAAAAKTKTRFSVAQQLTIVFAIFVGVFAIGWLAIAVFLRDENVSSALALHPTTGSDGFVSRQIGDIKCEPVTIPGPQDTQLRGMLFTMPGAKKIAIVNHGNAGNNAHRLYLAEALTKAKVNVFLYDYRGYGLSTGKATLRGILADGDAAYDYVRTRLKYEPSQIIIYGESIGTAVSCHVAAEHECAGLILQSPIKSLPAAAKYVFVLMRMYPDFVFPEPKLDNLQLISQIKCPKLFMHGLKDRIVDSQNSRILYDAAQEPKTLALLPECGHNDMGAFNGDIFNGSIEAFINHLK